MPEAVREELQKKAEATFQVMPSMLLLLSNLNDF
jgi:hypothetical protein